MNKMSLSQLTATAVLLLSTAVYGLVPSSKFGPLSSRQKHSPVPSSPLFSTALQQAKVPNLFKSLPWNVEKQRNLQAMKFKLERSRLHRELGIAEDATYEEIVEATDTMIARHEGDLKRKIQIEVVKDKILQIRLNERLAGLAAAETEASDQSAFERGADEDMATAKNKKAEEDEDDDSPPAPKWTEGLIKKPDRAHVQKQLRFYGTIMAIGVLLPPMEQLMSFMSFFVCIAQIGYRGMSEEEIAGGGMSYFGNAGGRNPSRTSSMRKSTFLCMFLALFNTIMSNILYPSTLGYKSYSDTLKFFIRTVLWGLEASYFQTYRPM